MHMLFWPPLAPDTILLVKKYKNTNTNWHNNTDTNMFSYPTLGKWSLCSAHLALQYFSWIGVICEVGGDHTKEVVLQKGWKDSFAKLLKMYFVILPLMPFVNNLRIYSRKQTLEQESARCRNNSFQTLEQTLRANKLQLKNFIFCQFLVLQISFQIQIPLFISSRGFCLMILQTLFLLPTGITAQAMHFPEE